MSQFANITPDAKQVSPATDMESEACSEYTGRIGRAWGRVQAALRSPLSKAVIASLACFAILQVLFALYVHHCFEGRYHGPFLMSTQFGVPSQEAAAGMEPVMARKQGQGWDGMFYYFQSNDPFARGDAKLHIDNPSYRYQRVGMPLLGYTTSRLLGFSITPPLLYHSLQFVVVSCGFGGLVHWLASNKLSSWYACAWLCSGGVILATFAGIPDAVGDALFVLVFLALIHQRIWLYALLASGLVLVREGYVVLPAMVFLITALNRMTWAKDSNYWKRAVITAIPGMVVIGWSAYLAWQLQISPLSPSRNTPGLVDWPLLGFWKWFRVDWRCGNYFEVWYKLAFMLTLVVITIILLRRCRQSVYLALTIPYVILTLMLGTIVWQNISGYPKAAGTILVIGIFLLQLDRSMLLRFVLAANVVIGLDLTYRTKLAWDQFYSPTLCKDLETGADLPPEPAQDSLVNDFRSSVHWTDPRERLQHIYAGIWSPFHREVVPIRVRITNLSDRAWYPNGRIGEVAFPIRAGAILFAEDGKKLIAQTLSIPLQEIVWPGESKELVLHLPTPPGKYVLQLSVVQENRQWFYMADPSYGSRHTIVVK